VGPLGRRFFGPGTLPDMNDTTPKIVDLIARRYAEMSPEERMKIASDMFDTAVRPSHTLLVGESDRTINNIH
jgi:hypothetical protein